jgi:peptide/nickel transport system ATP-binding protein
MKNKNNGANMPLDGAKPPVLWIKDFSVRFLRYTSMFERKALEVISSLDVEIKAGELLAIAGSSGSGKSLLAHAILGILPPHASVSGEMSFRGEPLSRELWRELRGREIAFIPQSVSFLDPLMTVGEQVRGAVYSEEEVEAVFRRYNLEADVMRKYPFELSGGMARRVLLASAVITGASLIVADEPTPGLSESLAKEALGHLRELATGGAAVMLITHDLRMAIDVADKIVIFYAGYSVETALRADFENGGAGLRHPYSKALLEALPQTDFTPLPGNQPYAGTLGDVCVFFPRCKKRSSQCQCAQGLRELRGGFVRCVHAA